MSTIAKISVSEKMTADEFLAWDSARSAQGRYELVDGYPVLLQAERAGHNETKASAWLALRTSLRGKDLDCTAFTDGMSVRIDDQVVREPDAVVHCGPYDRSDLIVSNPIIVVEVISPSSVTTDASRKLIDYFSVPSIQHYLILYGDEERVVHHRRTEIDGEIATRILGRGDVVDLSPPGFPLTVDALFDS
jgi:Uma2 family endonuclease